MKVLVMGPVSLVLRIRVHAQQPVGRHRTRLAESDDRAGAKV